MNLTELVTVLQWSISASGVGVRVVATAWVELQVSTRNPPPLPHLKRLPFLRSFHCSIHPTPSPPLHQKKIKKLLYWTISEVLASSKLFITVTFFFFKLGIQRVIVGDILKIIFGIWIFGFCFWFWPCLIFLTLGQSLFLSWALVFYSLRNYILKRYSLCSPGS